MRQALTWNLCSQQSRAILRRGHFAGVSQWQDWLWIHRPDLRNGTPACQTYVKLFPESRFDLLVGPPLHGLPLCRLVQQLHSAVDVCRVHSSGVVRLRDGERGERERGERERERSMFWERERERSMFENIMSLFWSGLITHYCARTFLIDTRAQPTKVLKPSNY